MMQAASTEDDVDAVSECPALAQRGTLHTLGTGNACTSAPGLGARTRSFITHTGAHTGNAVPKPR